LLAAIKNCPYPMKKNNEIIQGLWIGKSLSLMERLSLNSFLARGHAVHLYAFATMRDVPEGVVVKDANKMVPKETIFKYKRKVGKGSYAGFSNLFRYKLLLDKGGIWSDLDVVCLKQLDFGNEYVFATEHNVNGGTKICAAIIKAPAGCELMEACYREARQMDPGSLRWNQMGSDLLGAKVDSFGLRPYLASPVTLGGLAQDSPFLPWKDDDE